MNIKGAVPVITIILSLICFLHVSNSAIADHGLQNNAWVIGSQVSFFLFLIIGGLYLNYFYFSIRRNTICVKNESKSSLSYAGIRIDGKRRLPCLSNSSFPYIVKPGDHMVEVVYKSETMTVQTEDAWKSIINYCQDCSSVSCTTEYEKKDEKEVFRMEKQMCYVIPILQAIVLIMAIGGFCYITAMMTW